MRFDDENEYYFALVFTATFLTATSVAQAQGDAARGEKKFENVPHAIRRTRQ